MVMPCSCRLVAVELPAMMMMMTTQSGLVFGLIGFEGAVMRLTMEPLQSFASWYLVVGIPRDDLFANHPRTPAS